MEVLGAVVFILMVIAVFIAGVYIVVQFIEAVLTIPDMYEELVKIRKQLVPEKEDE